MELGSIANRVSTQASAQRSAQMSLVLPRKTLELQALHITGPAVQSAAPIRAPSDPPHPGNSIDVTA